jgi:hypothetical protein
MGSPLYFRGSLITAVQFGQVFSSLYCIQNKVCDIKVAVLLPLRVKTKVGQARE